MSDSETALMEKGKLLVGMYELADGLRIPMWRAITSCECVTSTQTWLRKNLGGKWGYNRSFSRVNLGIIITI